MRKSIVRLAQASIVLGIGMAIAAGVSQSSPWLGAVARVQGVVGEDTRHQGHFVNQNTGDVAWTLAPAYAATAGETVGYELSDKAYTPNNDKGDLDDYHCFLVDPQLAADTFVTGVSIKPGNRKMVHHAILYRVEPSQVPEALERNKNGAGWTCFTGTGLTSRGTGNTAVNPESLGAGSAWVGAWVPGAKGFNTPSGIGVPIKKGSMLVMQVHYNLANGLGTDQTSFELTYAPKGSKLQAIRNHNLVAPVELPCPETLQSTACQRERTLQKNADKIGAIGRMIPPGLLYLCDRKLEDYQKNVGDASNISTSCERRLQSDATLYSVSGHMHLLGKQIKTELISSNGTKTLLNIPKWDFHWQGDYWFVNPVEVKKGDILRVTCVHDNSAKNRPYVGSNPLEMRYITWGEGTSDEMCLSTVSMTSN